MRIALLGGSFNPPHVAHQLVCTVALATARPALDQVWLIPTWQHPFGKPLAPYSARVAMCERAAQPFGGRVVTSRIEEELGEELGGPSYTVRTVLALRARHPEAEFVLTVGSDLVAELPSWRDWPELERLVSVLVVGRAGQTDLELALPAVSSTAVRQRIGAGLSVAGLVPAAVVDYIEASGLYRGGK